VELTFNGHACLTLRAKSRSLTVVTDPYRSGALGGRISHAPVKAAADIVTVSHYHVDHSHVSADLGTPVVADLSGDYRGVRFEARSTYHDRFFGTRMGMTTMMAWEMDGLRVAHLGDIGCDLTPEDVAALGRVDVLLWPVGGTYTLGPEDAPAVLRALSPKLAIPLHFEHERCQLGMQPVEAAIAALENAGYEVNRNGQSRLDVAEASGVVVLEPAL